MSICKELYGTVIEYLPQILSLRNKATLKNDMSYVTEGDFLCQEVIYRFFSNIPDYYVISEEKNNSDFCFKNNSNIVVVDPIDGTENFKSGLKEWGIGVSIYHGNSHVESMIAIPEMDILVCSGDMIKKHKGSRIRGLSSSLTKKDLLELEEGFEYRIIGCCMYNMYNTISGSYASFQNPKGACCWDILPGLNLALEHGLEVEVEGNRYYGEFLSPAQKYRFIVRNR